MTIDDFEKAITRIEDHAFPIAALIGAMFGADIGFSSNGTGGTILGVLFGTLIGGACFVINMSRTARATMRMFAAWCIVMLVILVIYLLWNVGQR